MGSAHILVSPIDARTLYLLILARLKIAKNTARARTTFYSSRTVCVLKERGAFFSYAVLFVGRKLQVLYGILRNSR